MNERPRMYADLAWAWPIVSPPEHYVREAADFTHAILAHATGPIITLLDLGCGGGHNDSHLKKRFEVTGVDINPGMLANARKLNPEVKYVQGDMRSVMLGRKFDSVIIADSIMYMLTEQDMVAAFRTAYGHLRPGGVFCTYAEVLPDKFSGGVSVNSPGKAGDTEVTLVEYKWDPDVNDTTLEFLFLFIIKEKGAVRVETDRHTCGIFSKDVWVGALRRAGFNVGTANPTEPGCEIFFVCTKSPE